MLKSSDSELSSTYDLAMLDLDGVVYIGRTSVPGAATHLAAASAAGMHLAYITNNASRPPLTIAEHLTDLGIPAREEDVVTAAQAAAHLLAQDLPRGSAVFVIGGLGLFEALREEGLEPVQSSADQPVAVVSGYAPDLQWRTVSEGAILIGTGLPWVASNTDLSVPTPLGRGLGNGVLVEAVARFTGRDPVVAGKPRPPLFEETRRRVGGDRPLMVGDRLDTDIEGAVNSGFDSLLVLTGVTGLPELVAATPARRPSYISAGLEGLCRAHPAPERDGDGYRLGGWYAAAAGGGLAIKGTGAPEDWWRVVAAAGWRYLDETGTVIEVSGVEIPGSASPLDAPWTGVTR